MEKVATYKNVELVGEEFELAELPKIRNEFIAKLENALMFLNYRALNMWHSEAKSEVLLKVFDGAWLTDISLKHKDDEVFALAPFGDLQVTPDMFPKLNIKLLNLGGEIGHMTKIRLLDSKEKRNLGAHRYIYSEKAAFLDYGKQKWWTDEGGYGFDKMQKTKDGFNYILPIHTSLKAGYQFDNKAVTKRIVDGLKDENSMYLQTIRNLHMAMQLSLTYDYEWSCYIRETQDSIGVRIPIHPSSSKEVFIMRNVPEGKSRKRAIVNFVKDHYRTIKGLDNNERQILIKKHFRGDLKFNWRGLEVHITPSPYDLRRTKTTKKFRKF